MMVKIQPTIPLQIFCEFLIDSEVIFKSSIGPDNICQLDLKA